MLCADAPFHRRIADGSTNMVGRMEGGQPDNYVFFVYEVCRDCERIAQSFDTSHFFLSSTP